VGRLQHFAASVLTTDSPLESSQSFINLLAVSPHNPVILRKLEKRIISHSNAFLDAITPIRNAEELMEKWKANKTRMNRFEQIFAGFGHFIPEFTGRISFGLIADKRFTEFIFQTLSESQKFDWVLLDFLAFCDEFDLISGTSLTGLAHMIPPQLTAVFRIIERFHRITPDPLFPLIFERFGGMFSLGTTDQELIDPDNWTFCHGYQIVG
jgi:hypothetical protein